MRNVIRITLKFVANWVFNALCLCLCAAILPGASLLSLPGIPFYLNAMAGGLIFTLLNSLIRPVILLLTMPLNGVTMGLFSLVVNGFFLMLLSRFSSVFHIDSLWTGIVGTFIFAFANIFLQLFFPIDDDELFFDILSRRILKRGSHKPDGKKGLIVLEIDGLSYPRLMRAIKKGKMPFLKELLDSNEFQVRPYDCGVPSQTSSCQAGIMFGRNENICAFRWYDKTRKKVISSSKFGDSAEMEKSLFHGEKKSGLLNGGLSVNNIMSGNAEEAMFTVSSIMPRDNKERGERHKDLYLFSSRPYLLTKSLIFSCFDSISEIFEYLVARIRNKQPRLNRIQSFYPLIRGVTNVLLRDISTAFIVDDINEGGYAIYTTLMGHDEIAHHSGPDSFEAIQALTGIDRAMRKIYNTARASQIRDYDFFVISDHGQSFGPTFKQRYGISLSDTIRDLALDCSVSSEALKVIGIGNSTDNDVNLRAVLTAIQPDNESGRLHEHVYSKLENILDTNESTRSIEELEQEAGDIMVLASGNLVNTYFSFSDQHVSYEEIEAHYPGFCTSLVSHEGVGVILVKQGEDALAIGKKGSRNLTSGEVSGIDPFLQYGEPEKRADQLSYLMSFEDIGDIVIFSPVYEDGSVAAYEELIGSHGGLGGEQTEPFLFHQSEIEVPADIRNSNQIFAVLNQTRERHSLPASKIHTTTPEPFSLKALWAQICNTKKWTPVLRDCLKFSPGAFKKVAADPQFEGPALLIALIAALCAFTAFEFIFTFPLKGLVALTLIIFGSGIGYLSVRGTILMLRAKADTRKLLRVLLFTSFFHVLWLAAIYPPLRSFIILIILLLEALVDTSVVINISNIGAKRSMLVLPVMLILTVLMLLIILMVYESLRYILAPDTYQYQNLWVTIRQLIGIIR